MPTVITEIEVDVDLDEFDDEDLIEEVQRRGLKLDTNVLIETIFQKRRLGQSIEQELDLLIYETIGRFA